MSKKKKDEKEYRTLQFLIKEGNPLNKYLIDNMYLANNLYNATNFHIRQVYTAFDETKELHETQKEVLNLFSETIPKVNKDKTAKFQRLIKEDLVKGNIPKKFRMNSRFNMPTAENKFVSYELLDAVFKGSKNKDYYSLPSHVNQGVMKNVYANWDSFFESLSDYRENSSKYKGKPRPPRYKTKNGTSELYFSNQVCKVKTEKNGKKLLIFPKTKITFNLSKHLLGKLDTCKLVQVRAQKWYNDVKLEIVLDCTKDIKPLIKEECVKNIMSIDLGVNNLVAGITSNNATPILVNGRPLKSINQWYNKQRAYLYSSLRINKNVNEGKFTTHRLEMLDKKRHLKIKDYMHKTSKLIVEYAKENDVHKVIVGYNEGWKSELDYFRKDAKQTFTNIPFSLLLNILEYKLKAEGIRFEKIEESYTSKASALDGDILPTYKKGQNTSVKFSGKRVTRGLYVSKEGITINADINGACNILRKYLKEDIELDYKVLSRVRKINIKTARKKSNKAALRRFKKEMRLQKMRLKRSLQSPNGIVDRTANCVAGQSELLRTSA